MTFDHVGIFVSDLEEAREKIAAILPVRKWGPRFDDETLRVSVCIGEDDAAVHYELVAPLGSPNPVSGILASGRNILNHIAYRVEDLDRAAEKMRATGAVPAGPPKPALAFGGARVIFFLTALGFMVELIEHE